VSEVADAGDEIRRLMSRGLDLYALGQVEEAAGCWRRVLELDPHHAEARDYLQAAGVDAPAPSTGGRPGLLGEAVRLLRAGELQEGLELLETIARREPADLEAQAYLELARAGLLRVYRARVGSGAAVPAVRIPPQQVMQFNLPAAAGFLLSLVDGSTSVDDLMAVSGMDPFDALRALSNLLQAGIVESRA
jgi:tetratricopeptide (TPR) repeat protein